MIAQLFKKRLHTSEILGTYRVGFNRFLVDVYISYEENAPVFFELCIHPIRYFFSRPSKIQGKRIKIPKDAFVDSTYWYAFEANIAMNTVLMFDDIAKVEQVCRTALYEYLNKKAV